MSSYKEGKAEVVKFIQDSFEWGSTVLDVGACDGIWVNLLKKDGHVNHFIFDAVEIYEPNIRLNHLSWKYRQVFNADIRMLDYHNYDLIIFGDVLEHMTVEEAQACIEYAQDRAEMIVVAVPFRLPQDELYGNPYERHIQDDLTHELFMERYPGFTPLWLSDKYGYYYWRNEDDEED